MSGSSFQYLPLFWSYEAHKKVTLLQDILSMYMEVLEISNVIKRWLILFTYKENKAT